MGDSRAAGQQAQNRIQQKIRNSGCDFALITHSEQRRTSSSRESTVMTERMRRGLTVEISSELKALLEKACNLFPRS
jgi:hypothetical protein